MQKIGIVFITFVIFLFFSFFAYIGYEYNLPYIGSALRYVAGPFFLPRELPPNKFLANYKNDKVKILIVPGHSNDSFGTQFKGIKRSPNECRTGPGTF